MQTGEGAGWRGICPSIGDVNGQLNFDFCLAETGSPLYSNGLIKLVMASNSPYLFAANCAPKPASGDCPDGLQPFESNSCCIRPNTFEYEGSPVGAPGFAVAFGTTLDVFTPVPAPVPASTPTAEIVLSVGLLGLGLVFFRKRWS